MPRAVGSAAWNRLLKKYAVVRRMLVDEIWDLVCVNLCWGRWFLALGLGGGALLFWDMIRWVLRWVSVDSSKFYLRAFNSEAGLAKPIRPW